MADFLAKARGRPAEVIKGEPWSERNFHLTIGLRSDCRYIRTYVVHASARTCAPETRSMRIARGCEREKRVHRCHLRVLLLCWPVDDGRKGDISAGWRLCGDQLSS